MQIMFIFEFKVAAKDAKSSKWSKNERRLGSAKYLKSNLIAWNLALQELLTILPSAY